MTTLRRAAVVLLGVGALAGSAFVSSPADAATNVCTGVTGCRVVASSDIDGDSKADQIGMVYKKGVSITVRVKTATRTMQTTGQNVQWFWEPLQGVTDFDGRAGNEIVVGDTTGANTIWFRVITYRGGKLVTVPRPAGYGPTGRWAIQSSNGGQFGYERTVTSTGRVRLVERTAERVGSDSTYTGKDVTYRWSTDKWVRVSSQSKRYSSYSSAATIYGWEGFKGLSQDANTPLKSFSSCTALNKVYSHGVGRFGAKDSTSGTPVTDFRVASFLYLSNNGPRAGSQYDLDRDNDGIACEKR